MSASEAIKMDKRFGREGPALDEGGDEVGQPLKAKAFMSHRARLLQRRPALPFTLGGDLPDPFVDARQHASRLGRAAERSRVWEYWAAARLKVDRRMVMLED